MCLWRVDSKRCFLKNRFCILSFLIVLIFSFNVDAKEVRPDYEIGFGTVSTSNGVFTMIPFINYSLHTGISFNVTYIDLNLTIFPYGGSFDLNYAMGVYFDFTKQRKISNILLMEGDFIFYFGEGKRLANDGYDYTSYTLSSGPGLGYKFIERYTIFNIYFTLKAVIHFVFWEKHDGIYYDERLYSRLVNYAVYSSFGIVF